MKRFIVLLLLGIAPFATAELITTNLIIHLDASTLQLNNGDAVTSWTDSAAGGPDASLSAIDTLGTPTFKTDAINGYSAVSFSGSSILGSAQFDLASAGTTIFAVFTGGATGTKTERMAQFGDWDGTNGQVLGLEVSTSTDGAADGGSGFRFNNGNNRMTTNNPLTTAWAVGAWKLGQGAKHSTAKFYVNDVAQTWDVVAFPDRTVSLPATQNTLTLGTGRLNSTTNYLTGDYYTGDLAELLVYNDMLTATEIGQVNDYLMAKYAIPEPATLVLLGLGSLLAVRCRKA